MNETTVEELEKRVRELGSLDALVAAIRRAAEAQSLVIRPYSKGTWSRILRRLQRPTYNHLVQIALACGKQLPPPPPEVLAQQVKRWETVGDGRPQFGLLLDGPARIRVTPTAEAQGICVRVVTPRKRQARLPESGPIPPERLGRGKSGNPEAIRRAAVEAAKLLREVT